MKENFEIFSSCGKGGAEVRVPFTVPDVDKELDDLRNIVSVAVIVSENKFR